MVAGLVDAALVVTTPAEADSPGVTRAIDELRMAGATTVGVLVRRPGYPFATAAAS
jgi:Mrp family chromosome partitioning ATPase